MANIKSEAERCLKCKKAMCSVNCPVETAIPEIMDLFLNGEIRKAGELLFRNNPMSAVTSIICPHERNCFGHCVLGKKGTPVEFYKIEQYISRFYLDTFVPPEIVKKNVKTAVVGAGPAGMAMAMKLLMEGYDVTLFDENDNIGGVLRYGIPEFRLAKDIIDKYYEIMIQLGLNFRPNTRMGDNIKADDLFLDGYKAVFIATGAALPRRFELLGETLGHVHFAINFLKSPKVNKLGKKVVVIGAGNVAMDAARTAIRIHHSDVTIIHKKSEKYMTADREEIDMAIIDGIEFMYSSQVVRITDDGVICCRVNEIETEDGVKFEEDYTDTFKVPADSVIIAIGQGPGSEAMSGNEIGRTSYGFIEANENGETSEAGVFAAGDIVTGPRTAVEAVAYANRVAETIIKYLENN